MQVTSTCIKSLTISNIGLIQPPTVELTALERLKNPHWLIMEKRCLHFFSAVYDQVLMILAGNEGINQSLDEFEFGQDLKMDYGVSCL